MGVPVLVMFALVRRFASPWKSVLRWFCSMLPISDLDMNSTFPGPIRVCFCGYVYNNDTQMRRRRGSEQTFALFDLLVMSLTLSFFFFWRLLLCCFLCCFLCLFSVDLGCSLFLPSLFFERPPSSITLPPQITPVRVAAV